MSDLVSLFFLLGLVALVMLWLRLTVARERAVHEARLQSRQHGVQLLDETVGMRAVRLRRVNGIRRLERCYGFEVSTDGGDRQSGRLWMIGRSITGVSMPSLDATGTEPVASTPRPRSDSDNVVELDPRRRLH